MAVTENMVYKLDIQDNTKKAADNINNLSKNLKDVEKALGDVDSIDLSSLGINIKQVSQSVENLSKNSKYMKDIQSNFEAATKNISLNNISASFLKDAPKTGYLIGLALGTAINTAIGYSLGDFDKFLSEKSKGSKKSTAGTLYAEYFVDSLLHSIGTLIIARFPKEVHQSLKSAWDLAYRNFIMGLPEASEVAEDIGLGKLTGVQSSFEAATKNISFSGISTALLKASPLMGANAEKVGYYIGLALGSAIPAGMVYALGENSEINKSIKNVQKESQPATEKLVEYWIDSIVIGFTNLFISRFPKEVQESLKLAFKHAVRTFVMNNAEMRETIGDLGMGNILDPGKGVSRSKVTMDLPMGMGMPTGSGITGPVVNPAISMGVAALTGGLTDEIAKFLDQAQMDKYSGVISTISENLNGLSRPLKNSIDLFSDLTEVIKILNDPKQVYNISQLLITIADLFEQRGQFQLADTLLEFSKVLESTAIKLEMTKDETDQNFSEMVQGAKSFDATLKTLGTTLGVVSGAFAGARLFEYLRTFDKFKTATDPLINNMLKLKAVSTTVLDFIKTRFHLSFLSAAEAVSLLSPAVMFLGDKMKESDSNLVKFAGNVVFLAGVIGTGLTGALSFVLSKLGGFIESIGTDMIQSLTAATDKFIKFESVMKQFQFTVSGFIKTFSVDAVGSLSQWNQMMEEIFLSTVFTREEIAKSIKLLVAEGQVIGMTYEQNAALLQRITDIAASSGRELSEVTQMVVAGLTNNADATISLGIDIRNTALAHSEYAKKANIAIEQMNAQEIAMARLNVLYERTVPIVGAAKHQVETIAGATAIYNKTLDDIKISMGDAGVASQFYLTTMIKIATFFAKLPKPILVLIGNIKDFVGVLLILMGKIISLTALLLSAITIFGVLNLVLVKLGFTAISLSGIFTTLMFKILPFLAGIIAVGSEIEALKRESEVYKTFMNQLTSVFGSTDDSIVQVEEDIGILTKTINYFSDVIKQSLLGLAQTINYLAEGIVHIKMAFASGEDEETYRAMLLELEMRTAGLTRESNRLGSSLLFLSESTAMAADSAENMAANNKENIDLMANLKKRVIEAAKAINEGFDVGIEKQKVLGNEFEKAAASYKQATNEMENVFKRKSGERELAQKYADLEKASISASFEIEKLRLDTLKKFSDEINAIQIDSLKKQGKNITAIKEETKLRMKLVDEQEKGLRLLPGGITNEELSKIEEYRKAILGVQKASISEERAKQLQKISDLQKQIGEIQRESLGSEQNAILDLRAKIESRKEELIQTEKQLKAANDLTSKAKELLNIGKESLDLSYKNNLIKMQKDLSKETIGLNQELVGLYFDQEEIIKAQTQAKREEIINAIWAMERVKNQGVLEKAITNEYFKQLDVLNKIETLKIYEEQAKALGDVGYAAYKTSQNFLRMLKNAPDKMMVDVEYNQKGEVGKGIFNSLKDSWNKGIKFLASPFDKSMVFLSKISLRFAGAFSTGATWIDNIVSGIGKIFDPEFIQGLADMLGNIVENLPDALMKAFEALDKVVVKIIDKLPDIISKLMDSLSSIIGRIMEKLPDLINALMDGLVIFLQKLPEITQKIFSALPAILQAFLSKLPEVIKALFKAIPQIIKQILDVLPEVITTILDNLPEIIETIIIALLDAVGNIVNFVIDFVIGGGLEKIIKSIIVAIPRIIGAIIMGVIRGLGKFWDALWKGGAIGDFADTIEELPKKMELGIKKLAKAVAKESSQVFKVLDLDSEAKAVDRLSKAKSVTDVINAATDYLNKRTKGLWDQIIDGLTKMWRWVYDKILEPIINLFTKLWRWVYDKILEPVIGAFTTLWRWVYDKVFEPVIKGVKDVFQWVWDKIFKPIVDAFSAVFNWVNDYIFKPIMEGIKRDFRAIQEGLMKFVNFLKQTWDSAIYWISAIWTIIWETYLSPFINSIRDIFMWVWENIFKPIIDGFNVVAENFKVIFAFAAVAFSAVWDAINTNIFQPVIGAFNGIFEGFKSVFSSISEALSSLGNFFAGIGEKIKSALNLANFDDFAKGIGDKIASFFKGGLSGIAQTIADSFSNAFSQIGNLAAKMFSFDMKGKGRVEETLGIDVPFVKFGYGGIVGSIQQAAGGVGDSLKNDVVPALLSPGEAVIPRSLMSNPMVSGVVGAILTGNIQELWNEVIRKLYDNLFDMITSSQGNFAFGGIVGGMPTMGKKFDLGDVSGRLSKTEINNYDISLTMNLEPTNTELDSAYVRNKLMPAIKDELKKSSLKGDFIIANRGVRNV